MPNNRAINPTADVYIFLVLIDAVEKILLAPAANASLRIGRDICADNHHSRKAENFTTGQGETLKRLPLFGGCVAPHAAQRHQIFSILLRGTTFLTGVSVFRYATRL